MAVTLSPVGGAAQQFFDNNGNPLVYGKLYSYAAGTTTPQATYTSSLGDTAHSNPINLDSAGRIPGGEVWLPNALVFKFALYNANDELIGTYDNVSGINASFLNFEVDEEIQTATAAQTLFTLTTVNYQPGTNSLQVYVDGINQYVNIDYTETSSTEVTFTTGLTEGQKVKFIASTSLTSGVGSAAGVSYLPAGTGAVATNVQAKLRQTITAADYGATGDGTTDDRTALQNAINATPEGGTLYIPGSNVYYKIDATELAEALVVDKPMTIVLDGELRGTTAVAGTDPAYIMHITADNVTLRGSGSFSGEGTTVQTESDGLKRPGLLRVDGDYCTVDGITFLKQPEVALFGYNSNYLTVQNCTVRGYALDSVDPQYYAVDIEGTTVGCKVVNNTFLPFDGTHYNVQSVNFSDGLHYSAVISGNVSEDSLDHFCYLNVVNSVVSNNTIRQTVSNTPIKLNAGSGNVVSGNAISGYNSGMSLINQSELVVTGNVVSDLVSGIGINVYDNTGGTNAFNNIVITGNIVKGDASVDCYFGIFVEPTAACSNILVEGNVIVDMGLSDASRSAIAVYGGGFTTNVMVKDNQITGACNAYGILINSVDEVEVSSNRIVVSTCNATNFRGIYLASCDGAKIDNNFIKNDGATAVTDIGIYVPSGSNYTITNNTVLGWTYAPGNVPWELASSTFGGNVCSTDGLNGTFTMAAAATTTINNKNIILTTPSTATHSFVQLTPLNAAAATLMGSVKSLYVSAMTPATSFAVATADGLTAVGTEKFAYRIVQ